MKVGDVKKLPSLEKFIAKDRTFRNDLDEDEHAISEDDHFQAALNALMAHGSLEGMDEHTDEQVKLGKKEMKHNPIY